MELYDDLKISGKGLYNIINDDNIYTNEGIIFRSVNSNKELSINNLNIAFNQTSINFNNENIISLNNILNISSNSNIGIGLTNPQFPLQVSGTISCQDIYINNSILNKDFIKNIGFSVSTINNGILKINNGGTSANLINNEKIFFGNNQQSSLLIWKNDEKKLGINLDNPTETIDISGDINTNYYRINGNDINNIFIKNISITSNECFTNTSNWIFLNSFNYTNNIGNQLINIINLKEDDWIKTSYKHHYIQSTVGIGTTSSISTLSIVGDINYTGQLRKNGVLLKIFYGDYAELYNSPGYTWDLSNGLIFNMNNSAVGIGSQIPKYKLDIIGGINFKTKIYNNGNIINFFNGNYNNLFDIPLLSKFANSGSYYDLSDKPYIFNNNFKNLINKPLFFPTNLNSSISNLPIYFNTEWNTNVMNKPEYFDTDWNSTIKNKPKYFDTDWDFIYNKPDYFFTDWKKTVINKPISYIVDWNSNIINKPNFSLVAFTGDFNNLLNKPYIFSGIYKDLINKPNFSSVAFSGNYNDLLNRPTLFSGDYNKLSNIPIKFKTDWKSNIVNKPNFHTVSYTGLFKDVIGANLVDIWGINKYNIYSCNISNIGIGINNPSFKYDVKGKLNLNEGLIIEENDILKNNKPWGIYFAEDFSNNTLYDSSGNQRDAIITTYNDIIKGSISGNGAIGNINYIRGNTLSKVIWPSGSIPSRFTILSLTRYSGSSKFRILSCDSSRGNWLHGHWGNNRGVCHYDGWKTTSDSKGNIEDWLCCIGKNSDSISNNIIIDDKPMGTNAGGGGNYRLCINDFGENSDWELSCVIIWDINLTDEECKKLSKIIQLYLNLGGSIKNFFKNIYIKNDCYLRNSNNFNFLNSNDFFKTSNWNIDNLNNIYNLNNGSIGINNINPSSLYKLDVNGIINTNSYLNLLTNNNISWSSYNSSINYFTNNYYQLNIKSDLNKKIILNNCLFIKSGNIGIGTTNPSSLLHINNPLNNQEVKISLSTSFLIYKSINNEGFIWNSTNKNIFFGINNIEKLILTNSRNIGIGTTNPVSILHIHNPLNNQEVKLLLFTSFSIYKSTNNEGFIWNSTNNHLIFATNNTERLRITNTGNIGIGTTNPSSILHIHNPLNNQEVKLSLSSSFSIYKQTNHEGIIWNTNRGISFGTNNTEKLAISIQNQNLLPWGIYFAGNFSNNTLYDISGNGRHATTSGTINSYTSNGNGATANIKYISGGKDASIIWPSGSIPENFTILSLTRYTTGTSNKILVAKKINNDDEWYHGHNNGKRGVCNYQELKTSSDGISGNINDWVYVIGKNGGSIPNNININGQNLGTNTGGRGNLQLGINLPNNDWIITTTWTWEQYIINNHPDYITNGWISVGNTRYGKYTYENTYIDKKSDWALSYVIIWDRHLSDVEISDNSSLINNYLLTGIEPSYISFLKKTKIDILDKSTLVNFHNTSPNNEVKINFTSRSSIGFSIYKSTNNEGYIWNSTNNHLIFGTNNTERLRITNIGNIGIGTTNPSSILHIHNPLNNQEVKLSLSPSFSIYKQTNHEGIIWNTNRGISFGTNNTERLAISSVEKIEPWGIYYAGNFDNNTLYDISGNGRHAITTGTINSYTSNGNGSTSNIKYISGDTSTTISWPSGSIPEKFTILSLTRYSGTTKGRILQSSSGNWFHGHYDGKRGVCFYEGWKTEEITKGIDTDWLCCIGKNEGTISNNILIDGVSSGIYIGGSGGGSYKLSINIGYNEKSDWSLSYVVIWNRYLSDNEMIYNNLLIRNYLSAINTIPQFVSLNRGGKINIDYNTNSLLVNFHNTTSNQEVKIKFSVSSLTGFTIYKGTNNEGYLWNNDNYNLIFGTNNIERIRINNTGNIGIGSNDPKNKLDINGIIKGTSFIGNGSLITNLDSTKFTIGFLNIFTGGIGTTILNNNQLLIGNGISAINQSQNLIWSNNRLGIGSTIPQSNLDVNGTINGKFRGNGSSINNLNLERFKIGRFLPIENGGLGTSLYDTDINRPFYYDISWLYRYNDPNLYYLQIGSPISTPYYSHSSLEIYGTINGIFRCAGLNITNIQANNITIGNLSIISGGTENTNLTQNQILVGNEYGPISNSTNIFWYNNRLGIKISNPQYTLDIEGDVRFNSINTNFIGNDANNISVIISNKSTDNNAKSILKIYDKNIITLFSTNAYFNNYSVNSSLLINNENGDILISTINVNNFIHLNSTTGKIGINKYNIDNTSKTLEINGNINFSGILRKNGILYRGIGEEPGIWTTKLISYYGTQIYFNSGSVGIGKTNPDITYLLDVNGNIKSSICGIKYIDNLDYTISEIYDKTITLNNIINNIKTSKISFNENATIELKYYNILEFNVKNNVTNKKGFKFNNCNVKIGSFVTNYLKYYPLSVFNFQNKTLYNNYYINYITTTPSTIGNIILNYTGTNTLHISDGETKYIKFTNNGIISFNYDITVSVVLYAGGGSGGGIIDDNDSGGGGGGGGGGVGIGTINFKKNIEYNIIIGKGGIGVATGKGMNGENTRIFGDNINEIVYGGGGGGCSINDKDGNNGGSGGGGGKTNGTNGRGGTATRGESFSGINANIFYYGNNGKTSYYYDYNGAGGGGGGSGQSVGAIIDGYSAVYSYITGSQQYFGGGGGAGYLPYRYINGSYIYSGGFGGSSSGGDGGNGAPYNTSYRYNYDGTNGGGGGGRTSRIALSGSGGDGGVIISYRPPNIQYFQNTQNKNISAYFMNNIIVKGDVVGVSDNRIKKDIRDLDSKKSLNLISNIKPKSFKYIDIFDKGIKNNYGFIAQDIIKLIPEAVDFRKDIIPNIMKKFNCYDNIIETNEDLTSKLFINDIIEIIDKGNKRNKYKILEISSNKIKIDKTLNDNECFIYGKEVNDFHILDKNIIYTLNISATKELNKKIKKQKKKLIKLSSQIQEQELILKEQELKFEEQEKQLKYLFINNNI
jgi:hypothetical protein